VQPIVPNRSVQQGELMLGLYDINQQRLIDNGGSVLIGDRLFIEIKYRTGFYSNLLIEICLIFLFLVKLKIILIVIKLLQRIVP
jgi:hypothetical protein